MSAPVRLIGSPADLGLAAVENGDGEGLVVALGETCRAPAAVRFLDHAPQDDAAAGERLIAPAGAGVWSHAPWPAADTLFDLAAGLPGETAVLAGDRDGLRGTLLSDAVERGMELEIVDRLDPDALRRAACVVLLDAEPVALPALAPAVLAAGRVLIAPRADITFGFQAQLDHLQFDAPERALDLAQSVLARPEAFERVRRWGLLGAERHRATRVYQRLAADVAADRNPTAAR